MLEASLEHFFQRDILVQNGLSYPHTTKELPFHYFDEHEYQKLSCYKKKLYGEKTWEGKVVLLTFDGVAHDGIVYVNGKKVGD